MEYSDGTPEVTYTYDETAVPDGKGRLTKAANAYSTTANERVHGGASTDASMYFQI
jgi:hypothetical protein